MFQDQNLLSHESVFGFFDVGVSMCTSLSAGDEEGGGVTECGRFRVRPRQLKGRA